MREFSDWIWRTHPEVSEIVERVARAMMDVRARPPGRDYEWPVLSSDPDFDELPAHDGEGCDEDEITQEAVLRLARAAVEAMRKPTETMLKDVEQWDSLGGPEDVWELMIGAALK